MVAHINHGIQFYPREADPEANPDAEISFLVGLFEAVEDANSCVEAMHGMADGKTADNRFWFDVRWVEQSAKTLRALAPGSDALLAQRGNETLKYPTAIHEAIQTWAPPAEKIV